MSEYAQEISEAARHIQDRTAVKPRIGLVLGSGWDMLLESVQKPVRIPYHQVPGMAASTVQGHAGEWVFGELSGQRVAVMSGRLHYYEGHSVKDVAFPIRVMQALGVETVILTNAAGAVNASYSAGDLMLITDHINMTGVNPLIGPNDGTMGPRFPDMTRAYDPALLALGRSVARDQGFEAREGVYAQMTGPSYETPAEIRMLRALGADAVGMSTVPEVVAARHGGMRVMGISCMSNMAAGVLDQPLSHEEVLSTLAGGRERFQNFMKELVLRI